MGRLLARSSGAFIRQSLGQLTTSGQTPFKTIRDAVAQDDSEYEAVRRVLAVMVKQKHVTITGEGDTATYQLTASGETLLNEIGGQ